MAIITTNLPPIMPLLRSWLSPCLGGAENSSQNTDNTQTEHPKKRSSKMRSASRASREPQDLHNKAMTERYFAGFHSQESLAASGEKEIRMQAYPIPEGSSSGDVAQEKTAEVEMDKSQKSLTSERPAIPVQRNAQATGRRPSTEDSNEVAQTIHEIV